MAGVKGKSGRRPMVEEIKRLLLVKSSYEVTQAYLNHPGEPLKEKAQIAVGVVKSDMAKPIVLNTGDNYLHITKVDVSSMSDGELIDFLTGRKNGLTAKPA